MVRADVIQALPEHVGHIALGVREADRVELRDGCGQTPAQAMVEGLLHSASCWTVTYDEHPVAMAGVVPIAVLGSVAVPWMIATCAVEANPRPFLRASKKYVALMREWYTELVNYVDARNDISVRYLDWLGFDIKEPEVIYPSGALFRRFELRGTLHV